MKKTMAALLCVALTAGAAPQPPGEETPIFSETVEVRVINIEVVVTDDREQRVRGLGPTDFRVTVDGQPTSVDFFTEIAGGDAATSLVATDSQVDGPVSEGETVQTRYLVFIDSVFSQQHHRDIVLSALEEDVAEMRAEEWMAVVQFDGRKLELLSGWSNNQDRLRAALQKARATESLGFHRLSELRRVDEFRQWEREVIAIFEQAAEAPGDRSSEGGGGQFGGAGSDDRARAMENLKAMLRDKSGGFEIDYARMVQDQVRSVALTAAAAMRGLSDDGGRKAVLLLAGGWPSQPLEYAMSDGTQNTTTVLDAVVSGVPLAANDPLRIITETANRLGYTLYPIDVPGFQRADSIGQGAATDSAFLSNFAALGDINNTHRERELFLHDSLESLAYETGGKALINAQRTGSLPAVRADTRDYYWLGLSRRLKEDDEHHSIEIEVVRRGLRVRARSGFLDMSSETEADLRVEAVLLFDNSLDTGLLQLALGEPVDPDKKRLEVPLDVGIPLDEVTIVATGGIFAGELEIRISVMDENGLTASSDVRMVAVEGDAPPSPGSFYTYSTVLEIRNRNHKIVVGVRDVLGGLFLAGATQLEPSD